MEKLSCSRTKMPSRLSGYCPSATPSTPLLSQASPVARFKRILPHKCLQKRGFSVMKLIPLLLFILSTVSIFRFLKITFITSSISSRNIMSHLQVPLYDKSTSTYPGSSLTEKEKAFLLEFFSQRVPCNLLIFGLDYQYSSITSLNAGGKTIVLEDNRQETSMTKSNNSTQVYKILYNTLASEAYELLRHARENKDCLPKFRLPRVSRCNLALSNLPQEVYDAEWDVVVVDGPRGDKHDSPGKMTSIYTAGVIARRGNTSHVLVHDVDRMIEKWFSWEFLCDKNLVSSKGRFWHFQILGLANATTFCSR